MTYTFSTGSGFLNNPPRVVLIGDDNRPGSYPVEVSPVLAAKSAEYAKPYRDNIFPDTRSPYAQAQVVFAKAPAEGKSITLTNAQGQAHTFTFKLSSPNFVTGPTSYDVSYGSLSSTPREGDEGLTRLQVVTKRALEKFVQAVNTATGSLITATPTSYYDKVILTQRIPGTAGNTANSTTSADVTIESFTGGNAGEIRYPFGIIASGSGEVLGRVLSTAESGTLDVPAAGNASLLNAYSDGHPYAVFQPYDESNAQQAFGIGTGGSSEYGTQTQLYDDFFTRGSTLGNLDEPLSAKDKIVIDLVPSKETSLLSTTGSNTPGPASNFPMAYFNFSTKRWEPIGFGYGRNLPAGATTLQENLERQYLGFSQGWGNFATASNTSGFQILDSQLLSTYTGTKNVFQETGWFTPIDTFGFPLHPKYHATGSQQLDVAGIVDRPFLIEKIVYEFSASMPHLSSRLVEIPTTLSPPSPGGIEYDGGGGAFFILNQRKANPDPGQENSYTDVYVSERTGREFGTPQDGGVDGPNGNFYRFHYENGGIPRTMQLSTSGPSVYVDTTRDLITFARVGTVWSTYSQEIEQYIEPEFPHPAKFMDLAIEVPASGTFSGKYTITAPIRAPSQNSAISNILVGGTLSPNNILSIWSSKDSSTRNSIDVPTGRAYRGEFFGPEISYRMPGYGTSKTLFAPKSDNISSPYLVLPGDKLIFGWQSPTWYAINDFQQEKTLKILPGAGKLTLYGSYLQDDKPVHDIYKDQLNSDALHETLPSGPWVLDRFETEPQMCYSGSTREELVQGSILKNPSRLDIVRKIRARASSGNLGVRGSFFRNVRLSDSEEQYYDSMLPNPYDMSVNFQGSNTRILVGNPPDIPESTGHIAFGFPDERYIWNNPGLALVGQVNTAYQLFTNRTLFGSFPFDSIYENILREKKVTSKLFTNRKSKASRLNHIYYSDVEGIGVTDFYFITGTTDASATIALGSAMEAPYGLTRFGAPSFRNQGSTEYEKFGRAYASISTEDTSVFNTDNWPLFFLAGEPPSILEPYLDQNVYDPFQNEMGNINYHLSKFFGCFGDGYFRVIQYGETNRGFASPLATTNVARQIYRGCKHGLISPTPLFTNAIFNGTQFGQFRDMMEQRQYTRFSLADNTLTEAAASVQFINRSAPPGTLNITSGSATNSSNISKFATSEHPYDDALADLDQIWDRNTALPETLIAL